MADLHGCVLAILVQDGSDSVQINRLRDRLKEMGGRVHLLGAFSRPAAVSGSKIAVDATAVEVSPRYYDGIIIPGGVANRDPAFDNEQIIALLQAFAQERRPLGAVGEGVALLLDADLLEGRQIACSDAVADLIDGSGAKRVSNAVCSDRLVVTARDSAALNQFCELFARCIEEYRKREYVDEVSMDSFPGSDAPSNSAI